VFFLIGFITTMRVDSNVEIAGLDCNASLALHRAGDDLGAFGTND